jgi:hypothetical protein
MRSGRRTVATIGLALGAALGAGAARASITGVCPDGSIFIVQRADQIPCSDARQVEPHEVPPIKPEFLPRPYAWEVFHERQNPNNPYNLVDQARQVRSQRESAQPPPQAGQPSPPVPAASEVPDLGLADDEIRALTLIVELGQDRAPASFARGADGAPSLVLRLGRSLAFESRLRDAFARDGRHMAGPVLVFTAEATAPQEFFANLTFVQGHMAFHPSPEEPAQLGLVRGRFGALEAGEIVLGYVVLPAHVDLGQSLDIYWDDRRISAILDPAA